jgi:hypothetical protein
MRLKIDGKVEKRGRYKGWLLQQAGGICSQISVVCWAR